MKLRWGFIGAGWIAATALAPAVHKTTNASLYAVASRDPIRSQSLNPIKIHNSYDDLINDPEIDAVYISLPNHLHSEWSIKALKAGKNVLCEKPLALNLKEAQLMYEVAEANKKLLVEAVWMRWHPRFFRTVDLVKSGAVGEITKIDTAFTFNSTLENNYRLSPLMGGGSFLDVGPYQVHLWSALITYPFDLKVISTSSNRGESGVDLTLKVTGEINQKIQVSAHTSFEEENKQSLRITGESGEITYPKGEAFTSWNQESSLLIGGNEEKFAPVDPYSLMIESFGNYVKDGSSWVISPRESLQVMKAMDQIRNSQL
jgi:predicted dehydrogenase